MFDNYGRMPFGKGDILLKKLKDCVKEFENDEETINGYKAVWKAFQSYPKNIDKSDVLLKFTVLNKLYFTNIIDATKMINHIHKLAINEKLDELIRKGELDAIEKIHIGHGIRCSNGKDDRDNYSFATKYCHFSNPKCFPLYDQKVVKALTDLRKREPEYVKFGNQDDLRDPQTFRNVIDEVKKRYNFSGPDYQQIDRALWVYGKILAKEW